MSEGPITLIWCFHVTKTESKKMKSRSLTVECPYEVKGCGDIVLAPAMWQLERGIVELCLERLFRFILSIRIFYFLFLLRSTYHAPSTFWEFRAAHSCNYAAILIAQNLITKKAKINYDNVAIF